jgi:hypothetical protein
MELTVDLLYFLVEYNFCLRAQFCVFETTNSKIIGLSLNVAQNQTTRISENLF